MKDTESDNEDDVPVTEYVFNFLILIFRSQPTTPSQKRVSKRKAASNLAKEAGYSDDIFIMQRRTKTKATEMINNLTSTFNAIILRKSVAKMSYAIFSDQKLPTLGMLLVLRTGSVPYFIRFSSKFRG